MTQKFLKAGIIVHVLALFVSSYLVYHHYELLNGSTEASFCSINAKVDCDTVNSSTYSEIKFDLADTVVRIPVATLGFAYCLLVLLLSLMALRNHFQTREITVFLMLSGFLSACMSLTMAAISLFVIKTICIMCFLLQLTTITGFVLMLLAVKSLDGSFKETRKRLDTKKFTSYIVTAVIVFTLAQGITYFSLYKPIPTPVFDKEEFLHNLAQQDVKTIEPGSSARIGNLKDPKITLVEFADFQCPTCAKASLIVHRLVRGYHNDVQLIFKHFPLDMSCNPSIKYPMHQYACEAARAVYCAKEQGAFEAYSVYAFENQKDLTSDTLKKWAADKKLDMQKFEACWNTDETKAAVLKEIQQGINLDVGATPTFFINGKKHEGIVTEPMLRALLKQTN